MAFYSFIFAFFFFNSYGISERSSEVHADFLTAVANLSLAFKHKSCLCGSVNNGRPLEPSDGGVLLKQWHVNQRFESFWNGGLDM